MLAFDKRKKSLEKAGSPIAKFTLAVEEVINRNESKVSMGSRKESEPNETKKLSGLSGLFGRSATVDMQSQHDASNAVQGLNAGLRNKVKMSLIPGQQN